MINNCENCVNYVVIASKYYRLTRCKINNGLILEKVNTECKYYTGINRKKN